METAKAITKGFRIAKIVRITGTIILITGDRTKTDLNQILIKTVIIEIPMKIAMDTIIEIIIQMVTIVTMRNL